MPRPSRGLTAQALTASAAAEFVLEEVRLGRLDPEAVHAVVEAAGLRPPPVSHPVGLTDREVEVVGLLARGLQTKQVARLLGISAKTADRHIQHAYAKIGVSTRAAATVFAMEHGLVAWGELPMVGDHARAPSVATRNIPRLRTGDHHERHPHHWGRQPHG